MQISLQGHDPQTTTMNASSATRYRNDFVMFFSVFVDVDLAMNTVTLARTDVMMMIMMLCNFNVAFFIQISMLHLPFSSPCHSELALYIECVASRFFRLDV